MMDELDIMQAMSDLFDEKLIKPLERLVEGQQLILKTMATKSQVEALEREVASLKQDVWKITDDLQQLKKAQ